MTVATISSVISPTANATLAFAIWASLGRNGAPADEPNKIRPVRRSVSSGMTRESRNATAGTTTKLASSASMISRVLRSGSRICGMVSARPTLNMLVTTKSSVNRLDRALRTVAIRPFLSLQRAHVLHAARSRRRSPFRMKALWKRSMASVIVRYMSCSAPHGRRVPRSSVCRAAYLRSRLPAQGGVMRAVAAATPVRVRNRLGAVA